MLCPVVERIVDEAAVDPDRGKALRLGLLERVDDASRAFDLVRRRAPSRRAARARPAVGRRRRGPGSRAGGSAACSRTRPSSPLGRGTVRRSGPAARPARAATTTRERAYSSSVASRVRSTPMSTEKSPSPNTSVTTRGGAASAISSQRTRPSRSLDQREDANPTRLEPALRSCLRRATGRAGGASQVLDFGHHEAVEIGADDRLDVTLHAARCELPLTRTITIVPAGVGRQRSARVARAASSPRPPRRPRGRGRWRRSRRYRPSRAVGDGCRARRAATGESAPPS